MTSKFAVGFVQEIIILFGFGSGLWMYIGFNPEDLAINSIFNALQAVLPSQMLSQLIQAYWIGGVLVALASLFVAFIVGKWWGLLAVSLAFFGGLFVSSFGVFLMIFGVLIGFIIALKYEQNYDSR